MNYPWHLYVLSFLYIIAGAFHFIKPKIYLRIMPRFLPYHLILVYISGFVEIVLGILMLIEEIRNIAIYGIIVMLLVFLLIHFYMLSSKKAAAGIPTWILIFRIPLQFLLMYWVYFYLEV